MPLDTEVGFGLGNFVLDGDPALSQKGGHSPTQLSAHVCCSQTAECIKIHSVRRQTSAQATPHCVRSLDGVLDH